MEGRLDGEWGWPVPSLQAANPVGGGAEGGETEAGNRWIHTEGTVDEPCFCRAGTECGGEGHLYGGRKPGWDSRRAQELPLHLHIHGCERNVPTWESTSMMCWKPGKLVETSPLPSPRSLPSAGAKGGNTSSASAFCACYFHFVSGFSSVGTLGLPVPQ